MISLESGSHKGERKGGGEEGNKEPGIPGIQHPYMCKFTCSCDGVRKRLAD